MNNNKYKQVLKMEFYRLPGVYELTELYFIDGSIKSTIKYLDSDQQLSINRKLDIKFSNGQITSISFVLQEQRH